MLMVFPVIFQSPGSFLCCFLLSPLLSLSMNMLSVVAWMSVVVVYAAVSLSAASFACRCSLDSAFKRACDTISRLALRGISIRWPK